MPIPTLIPPRQPSVGAMNEPKIQVREAEFGDGYTERSPNGLNHIRESYSLKFEMLTAAQAASLRAFLQERGGFQAFFYTPPGETSAMRFVCKTWKRSFDEAGFQTLTATFEQDFGWNDA